MSDTSMYNNDAHNRHLSSLGGSKSGVSPDWVSVLDLHGGYHGVASVVWHCLDPLSVIRLSKTCSVLAASLKSLYRTRWRLESLLSNFVEDAGAFRRLMRSTGAVLSGLSTAAWIYESDEAIDVLDVYAVDSKIDILAKHLDSFEHCLEHEASEHVTSTAPRHHSLRYRRPSWTFEKFFSKALGSKELRRVIRLYSTKDPLLEALKKVGDTTVSRNLITWDKIMCLFPGPSLIVPSHFCKQHLGGDRVTHGDDATTLSKYTSRGWPELCLERHLGDSYCWIIPLNNLPGKEWPEASELLSEQPYELYFFAAYEASKVPLSYALKLHMPPPQRTMDPAGRQFSLSSGGLTLSVMPTSETLTSNTTMGGNMANSTLIPMSTSTGNQLGMQWSQPEIFLHQLAHVRLDAQLYSSNFLKYSYTYVAGDMRSNSFTESRHFFKHLVSSRLEHLCLHWAAQAVGRDQLFNLPETSSGITPDVVRTLIRRFTISAPGLRHGPSYDGELMHWYQEFKAGTRVPRRLEIPGSEKTPYWCDAAESDRILPEQEPAEEGIFCCEQWKEDFGRFLAAFRENAEKESLKRDSDNAFLSDWIKPEYIN